MAEDLQAKLDKALSRIAALEANKSAAQAPQQTGIDPRQLAVDPIGVLTRAGVPVEHVTRVFVAHAMGDKAPPELRTLAMMGPQVSATQALTADLERMRQRLDEYEQRDNQARVRQSFSSLAADKAKYPFLAAAHARDPKLFDSEVDVFKGDAAALAEAIEGRLKVIAPALGVKPQPASNESADATKQGQSTETKQAQETAVSPNGADTTPPPLPSATGANAGKTFTAAEHQALKDRIVRKYSQKAAD